VHIGAMLFAGGYALAADRAMLRPYHDRFAGERRGALEELAAVHRWVILGLVLLLLSGLLQAAADINTYATSAVFWTKMVLVALLAVNGGLLRSAEVRALNSADGLTNIGIWNRVRAAAWTSVFLWTATMVAGVVLQNA
jgi:hypothetical protein